MLDRGAYKREKEGGRKIQLGVSTPRPKRVEGISVEKVGDRECIGCRKFQGALSRREGDSKYAGHLYYTNRIFKASKLPGPRREKGGPS